MAWIQRGWIAPGWIELSPLVVPETPPSPDPAAIITLGTPGAAVHMTALGTVAGLDLMHPRPASPLALHHDTPIVILGLPQGWHVSGRKTIRDGIAGHPSVAICRADLLDMGTISIRTAPLSANMLGTLTLGERPSVSMTMDDSDGYWSRLIGREGPALIGCNAGVYIDFDNAVLIPALVGTVGRFSLGDGVITLDIGDFKRSVVSEALSTPSAYVNLDDTLELRTAAAYSKPADADAILPRVYGDFFAANVAVPEDDDDGGFIPAVSINTDEWTYCIHDGQMYTGVAPEVYVNKTKQVASVYEWHPNEDYQGLGVVISYIKFLINPGEAEISTRMYGQITPNGAPITNPVLAIQDCFIQRGAFHSFDFDPTTCQRSVVDQMALGYQIHFVFRKQQTYREWLDELGMNFLFDHLPNAYGQLAITQDRSLTTLPVEAIVDIDATIDCVSTDTRGSTVRYDVDEANLINAIELEWQYDWTSEQYTETVAVGFAPGITLNSWRARQFSLRGIRTQANGLTWVASIFSRYSVMPGTVSLSVDHLRYIAAQPGTYIAFTWPRHSWERRLLKVLNVEIDVMGQRMSWECLDCGRNAADPLLLRTPPFTSRRRRRTFRILPRFRGIPLIPLGLSLSTGTTMGADGTHSAFVRATWLPVPQMHLTNYVVSLLLEGSSAPLILTPSIEMTEARFEGLPGLVLATVRVAAQGIDAVSPFGPQQTIMTAKDTVPPGPPTDVVVVGFNRIYHVSWNRPADLDVKFYQVWASATANIHEGASAWSGYAERANILQSYVGNNTTAHFWVKVFDNSLNPSAWSPSESGPGVVATLDGISASDFRLLAASRFGTAADNLLINGDGEAGVDLQAAPFWNHTGATPLLIYAGDRKYGERSLLFNHPTPMDSVSFQYPEVSDNGIYEVSGWISSGVLPAGDVGLGALIRVIANTGVTAFHIIEKRTIGGDPTPGEPSCGIIADNLAHAWTEVFCRFRVSGNGTVAVGPQLGGGGGQSGFVAFDGLIFRRLHRIRLDDIEESTDPKRFHVAGGTGSVTTEDLAATLSLNQLFATGIVVTFGRANFVIPNGRTAVLRVREGTASGAIVSETAYHNSSGADFTWPARVSEIDAIPAWNGAYVLTAEGQGGAVTVTSSSLSLLHYQRSS